MSWQVYFLALAANLAAGLAVWSLSILKRDVSIVDSLWSLFFLMTAGLVAWFGQPLSARNLLVLVLVAIWALRLSIYLTARNWGEPEDRRYRVMRSKHGEAFAIRSLFLVFGLQALLAWIIALPLVPAIGIDAPFNWLDGVALSIWVFGFVFEAGADYQLAKFKQNPSASGKVLDSGFWRYTRHPNYFGEFCIWWAYYLFALASDAWWSIVAPLVMSLLLLRISGVPMLEADIAERRPAYANYIRQTNAFIPGPRKRRSD